LAQIRLSVSRSLSGTEREADRALWAAVHACAAQDALTVLHVCPLHHPIHVQAHGAVARAGLAVGALFGLCFQAQTRPVHPVSNPTANDHKRRHPADGVAACPSPKDHGKTQEKGKDNVVDHEPGRASAVQWQGHGHTTLELEQWVHSAVATSAYDQDDDEGDPGDPDDPLDPVRLASGGGLVIVSSSITLDNSECGDDLPCPVGSSFKFAFE
jgi:hypothetical protein